MTELEKEVAALRKDVEMLKSRLPAAEPESPSSDNSRKGIMDRFMNDLREMSQEYLVAKNSPAGFLAGFVTLGINADKKGRSSGRYSFITQTTPEDLPADALLLEKVARLAVFSSGPLPLRILRELLRLRFEKKPMRRSAEELASLLNVPLVEIEKTLTLLIENGTLKKVAEAQQEVYEWGGNDLAAILLLHA